MYPTLYTFLAENASDIANRKDEQSEMHIFFKFCIILMALN